MRCVPLCSMELTYTGDFHLARPYGNESGLGWGVGSGAVVGERLAGDVEWSNHPLRRGDGVMQPSTRAVITTSERDEVFLDLTGRTVFVERDGRRVGRQLLMALFESQDEPYAWLNREVGMSEGTIDPEAMTAHLEVYLCVNDLV